MRRAIPCLMLLLGLPATLPRAAEVHLNGHGFTLPEGFEIELAAGPPLVDRPITADFDEQGRLYVSDSSGSNDKTTDQLEKKPHRILRLEDTDGDGTFDARTVYADKMMFPEGTLWYDGSLYVAAPPSIWKLTDTDNDGVADQRSEWFQGKTLTGCANDLHGPYLGPDGWIYWCKGAFAEQTYERPGKKPLVTKASHIFRCRPDGTRLEAVMTGGMDNPVDVAFTLTGERIFTTTFLQHPGDGKRDGLIHAVYGGVYGKDHAVLDGHPRTGELMPVLSHLGAAAPCGLTSYASTVFGQEYQHNLFACLFNMHKVTRHVLTESGSTYTSADSDFVVSNNLDFHPTDVLEDADGSLVIVDTGGWYKLCCPTSQLWKPDVLGGIYRVRKKGAAKIDDPRGLKIDWAKATSASLCTLLTNRRPAVVRRALHVLGQRGKEAVPPLVDYGTTSKSADGVRNVLWCLARIDSPAARAAVRALVKSKSQLPGVQEVALQVSSLWRESIDTATLLPTLKGHPLRLAAEQAGRAGDRSCVSALLHAASQPLDRFAEHSVIYALIELSDPLAMDKGLVSESSGTRRAALIALDQMENGQLRASDAAPLLTSSDALLRDTAVWLVDRHPEWGDSLAGFLGERLASLLDDAGQQELLRLLSRFAGSSAVQALFVNTLQNEKAAPESRKLVLAAIAASRWKEFPAPCLSSVLPLLDDKSEALRDAAVSALRAVPAPKDQSGTVTEALRSAARRPDLPPRVRAEALAAVPDGLAAVEADTLAFLADNVRADKDVFLRTTAADAVSRAKLTPEQLGELTAVFADIGPLEADRVLTAFKDCADEAVGLKLVAALKDCPAVTALRVDTLKAALAKMPASVQERAKDVYAALNIDPEKQKARLESLLASLKEGDVRRGQSVFHSQKAACAACHAMGYLGGRTGPDLTRIAQIRTERDLLESIVFPNSSFVRSYEPVLVVTVSGKTHSGILKSEGAEIVLATGPKEEVRIPRDEVDEIRPGNVSVMPSGLDQQLSPQDLADLIAFLKAAK